MGTCSSCGEARKGAGPLTLTARRYSAVGVLQQSYTLRTNYNDAFVAWMALPRTGNGSFWISYGDTRTAEEIDITTGAVLQNVAIDAALGTLGTFFVPRISASGSCSGGGDVQVVADPARRDAIHRPAARSPRDAATQLR
jgi:hypothetical protein